MSEFEIVNIEKTTYSGDPEHLRALAKLQGLEATYLGGSRMFLKVHGPRESIDAFTESVMPTEYDPRQQPHTDKDL